MCTWRPEVNIGCCFSGAVHIVWITGNWGFLIRLDWQATESQGSSCPSCPGQQHFTDYLSPRPNMYIILGSSSATR